MLAEQKILSLLEEREQKVLVINEDSFNLLEFFIIVNSASEKKHLNGLCRNRVLTETNRKKKIIVLEKNELPLNKKWIEDLFERADKCGKNIFVVNKKDLEILAILYTLVGCEVQNWLFEKLLHDLLVKYNNELNMYNTLYMYMSTNGYHIRKRKVLGLERYFQNGKLTYWDKVVIKTQMAMKNGYISMRAKMLHLLTIIHDLRTHKRYVTYLKEKYPNVEKFEILNKKNESASGSIFVKLCIKGKNYFIKGNECPVYNSMRNEIYAHRKMLEHGENKDFLCMSNCDEEEKYIEFPFLEYVCLRQYLVKRELTERELDMLGEFLVSVICTLMKRGIVHRDIRPENIAVVVEDGEIIKFLLIDFGCAYCGNEILWDSTKYWDRYFYSKVCGEFRYSQFIVDDAASAFLVFLYCGGKWEDVNSKKLYQLIGNSFV